MRILITGIAGGLAQRVAARLLDAGHHVSGVDYRPSPPLPPPLAKLPVHRANYNKTAIEDVFRKHRPQRVFHLGRVGNLKESLGKRFDLNVVGSQKVMNLCVELGVERVIVLSTFHIYGADPRNHTPISEDEPLRAGTEFPQLADAIQLDNMASTWVYQFERARVAVLRPTNVIGPDIHNAISRFLRQRSAPHLLGFDPMLQFIHQEDLADAVTACGLADERGIFNLAGRDACPFREALSLCGTRTYPLPSSLVAAFLRTFQLQPAYLVNFFKYPCIISDERFRKTFAWEPKWRLADALRDTVKHARPALARAS